MAVVWEFTVVSEICVSYEVLNSIAKEYKNNINIVGVFSIDDWWWSNKQKLDNVRQIEEELDKGKIITIEMQSKLWKSLGMYLEKEQLYQYTLWVSTEGFHELDIDQITDANKKHYNEAFCILDRLIKEYDIPFNYIAIGLESNIQCCAEIKKAISNSNNVIAWIIKNNSTVNLPEKIERYSISEELDVIIPKL